MESLHCAVLSLCLSGCIFFVGRAGDDELGGAGAAAGATALGAGGAGGGAAGGGGAGGAVCVGPVLESFALESTDQPVALGVSAGAAIVGVQTVGARRVAPLVWGQQLGAFLDTTLDPGPLLVVLVTPTYALAAAGTGLVRCDLTQPTCEPVDLGSLAGTRLDGLLMLQESQEAVLLAGKNDELRRVHVQGTNATLTAGVPLDCGSNGCESARGLRVADRFATGTLSVGDRVAFFTASNLVACEVDSAGSCALPAPLEQIGVTSVELSADGQEVTFLQGDALHRLAWGATEPTPLLADATRVRAFATTAGPGGETRSLLVSLDPEGDGPNLVRCPPAAQSLSECTPICGARRPAIALASISEGSEDGVVGLLVGATASDPPQVVRARWPR